MSEPNEKSGVSGVVSAVTSLKPGIAILKFWQGIVDLVLRAIVVVSPAYSASPEKQYNSLS